MTSQAQEQQFRTWLDRYRGVFVRIARSFTETAQDYDDLFQELLLQVWTSIPSFRADSAEATWIYRVALNRALVWRRGERKRQDVLPLDESDAAVRVDERAGNRERSEILFAAVRRLGKIDRTLVLLWLDGFSYREIAAVTHISESNVGARLSRSRDRLVELTNRSNA